MTDIAKTDLETFTGTADAVRLHMGVIRMQQLLEMLGLSRSMVYLKINPKSKYYDPKFPKPIKLGVKAIGWLLRDVSMYVNALK